MTSPISDVSISPPPFPPTSPSSVNGTDLEPVSADYDMGRGGRSNTATRGNTRREEWVTVHGPAKKQATRRKVTQGVRPTSSETCGGRGGVQANIGTVLADLLQIVFLQRANLATEHSLLPTSIAPSL